MGFHDLMRILGVGRGDEVIILGATCAVMVNAIIRVGAKPVYSDVDPSTFGSSSLSIADCISKDTKMIVAQHSFGIPCNIGHIQNLAKKNKIFLLEDCAITLGSKFDGINVGNFGDAALFSTDHTKPINTLTGGLVYSRDKYLIERLRASRDLSPDLSGTRQSALFKRFLIEMHFCNCVLYSRIFLMDLWQLFLKKITNSSADFLSDDSGSEVSSSYPYPAKLPTFLAEIGIKEIGRWEQESKRRAELLKSMIEIINVTNLQNHLPAAYKNKLLEIVPLRFVWSDPGSERSRLVFRHCLDIDSIWFMRPIIGTNEPLERFGYQSGRCPNAEFLGAGIVNIPCNVSRMDAQLLIELFRKKTQMHFDTRHKKG